MSRSLLNAATRAHADEVGADAVASCRLDCVNESGWRHTARGDARIWLRGYIESNGAETLASHLSDLNSDPFREVLAVLSQALGHFALIAATPSRVIAAVDWVRSIPLFYAECSGSWRIDDRADRLRKNAGVTLADTDADAALSVAMAGYTIDRATLYSRMHMLGPGECVIFEGAAPPAVRRYYTYRPWRVANRDAAALERELRDLTLDVVGRMIASLDGRLLAIPLSAGNDSRLIASAAKHLGYENVRCFAYGRTDNFELRASRAIAERLGYKWRFEPIDIPRQKAFFARDTYRRYIEYAESCSSVPFIQDLSVLHALRTDSFIPKEAVIANGNSGDFISGNHIPRALSHLSPNTSGEARKQRILDALVEKHFSLWDALVAERNVANVQQQLWRSIESAGATLGDPESDHGLYEYAEFQDRQCKYVITGQRIYEFLGHDWRLPLWDNAYLRFWEGVPLSLKAGQSLYVRMLHDANWGGVWRDIPVNRKTIRPRWLIPIRYIAKLAHAPLARDRWRAFERRYLLHWMEPWCGSAFVPYLHIACDRRGARHAVAWLAEAYLQRHGLNWRGATIALHDAASEKP